MTANELILVIYLERDIFRNHEVIDDFNEGLKKTLPNCKAIFLPSEENRIDCINPIMVSEEVYKGVSEKVNKANEILDKLINQKDTIATLK